LAGFVGNGQPYDVESAASTAGNAIFKQCKPSEVGIMDGSLRCIFDETRFALVESWNGCTCTECKNRWTWVMQRDELRRGDGKASQ